MSFESQEQPAELATVNTDSRKWPASGLQSKWLFAEIMDRGRKKGLEGKL